MTAAIAVGKTSCTYTLLILQICGKYHRYNELQSEQ